ncbi:MAG: tryptophan--tRNA ligase [Bacteroidales bacterium]
METVVSGIRSTGNLHLGNYFGALLNFTKMQHNNYCFFFIADLHALTTHPATQSFHENVQHILAEYLAAGLNPEQSTIFVQSDVPEISEMYVLLNMLAYKGELERTVSFKDKARKQANNINAGLLTYPVLMATDILIHQAHKVPVGKDQAQHLEMTRVLARRFNNMYNTPIFIEPDAYNFGHDLIKIPGLDGSGKMGKSEGNGIFLMDDEENIRKKVKKAITDTGEKSSEMSEAVKNLFTIMKVVSPVEVVDYFHASYETGTIRYGDMKNQLADDICKITLPIRKKIITIAENKDYLLKVRKFGAEKARESASKTLSLTKKAMGFR